MFVMGFFIDDFVKGEHDFDFLLSKGISGMPDISPVSKKNFVGYMADSRTCSLNRTVTDLKEIFAERVNLIFSENGSDVRLNRNNIKLVEI